jgi:hypothetical protein
MPCFYLLLIVIFPSSASAQVVDDCSLDDENNDSLVLSTGRARAASQTSLILDDITFNNATYSNIEINLDINTLTWAIERPFPPAGGLDLSNAEVTLISDNDIRIRGAEFQGLLYDATIVLNLNSTFSAKDVNFFTGGVSETNTSNFGSWNNSGGRDPESTDNPRYTLTLCKTQSIVIDLESEADTYLYLLDSNDNVIAENDDRDFSAADFNSRIETTLSAGVYTVVVASFSTGESDVFDIEIDTDNGDGALNLRAIPGTSFVDYASVSGHVSDSISAEPVNAAEILVFDFLAGNPDVTVYSDSAGNYFLRVFANRLRANTFNAVATADGCTGSNNAFGVVNTDNHATINFSLDCEGQSNPDPEPSMNDGELSVTLTSGSCTITQANTNFVSYEFALSASGSASGSVDTRFDFEWLENPGIVIESCGVWTYREGQQDCIRGPNDPSSTTWTGGQTVNLPQAAVTFNEPREITPFINRGGSLGSTHPANLELEPFVIACQ